MGLVDPRTTRHLRTAAIRAEERGSQTDASSSATVLSHRTAQGHLYSGIGVNPVAIKNCSQTSFVQNSFSACPPDILSLHSGGSVQYLLGEGANVKNDGGDEFLYDSLKCSKRISCAGPEWSAGRPGHTPTRRQFACEKLVEDSYAGQDWSAGRPGNRPFGASSAACPSYNTACIGPYGVALRQLHYTGPNPREEQLLTSPSTRGFRGSTSQQCTTSSRRFATAAEEKNASPARVVLHPRRPPYYCGGLDDDVYVWTSIVDRWLDTVRGEPSAQLTFIVSLLRGAAYEWYMQYETRTGCPGDWTTLRQAMLKRFGSSIRVEKARAGIY